MTKKKLPEWLRHFDLDILVMAATRYFMGRRTIATCAYARELATAWPELPDSVKTVLRRDLKREFELDDMARERAKKEGKKPYASSFPLGDTCDRESWELVRNAWLKEEGTCPGCGQSVVRCLCRHEDL